MLSGDTPQALLPLACRVVASDQWLTISLEPSWKISQIKKFILAKLASDDSPDADPPHTRYRSVSPITFASVFPSRSSLDRETDSSFDDDREFDSDTDVFPLDHTPNYRKQPSASSSTAVHTVPDVPPPPPDTRLYSLVTFSTGQLLEEEYTLSWYRLRPNELLELHPPNTIVRLPREIMLEYVQPYFEVKVRALRVIISEKDVLSTKDRDAKSRPDTMAHKSISRRPRDGIEPWSPGDGKQGASIRKRKKTKLEWRDRWLIIHHGMLNLYKNKSDVTPVHSCSLTALTTLRGAEDVVHAAGQKSSAYVVCAKFRTADMPPPPPNSAVDQPFLSKDPAASPTQDAWIDPWSGSTIPRDPEEQTTGTPPQWARRGSKEDALKSRKMTADSDRIRSSGYDPRDPKREGEINAESFWHDLNIGDGSEGIWLILDMINEAAQSNFLRILHRFGSDSVTSTFIPAYLLPNAAFPYVSSSSSSSSYGHDPRRPPFPYPEWRTEVAKRAHVAGLGGVGSALSWIIGGGGAADSSVPGRRKHDFAASTPRRGSSSEASGSNGHGYEPDADEDDDFSDCELEWDGWMRDLARQTRATKQLYPADDDTPRRRYAPPSALSNVTSPDLEAFYRQPRERASAPSMSAPTYGVTPASAPAHQFTPLSDIPGGMEALSAHAPALLTTPSVMTMPATGVTTSTVSVGGVIRARSLTAANEDGRGRGVPRAMEVLHEGLASSSKKSIKSSSSGKKRERVVSATSSRSAMSPTSTIMSIVSAADTGGTLRSQASGSSGRTARSAGHTDTIVPDAELERTATRTSTRVAVIEPELKDKRSGGMLAKAKAFSPERLVNKLDSALDFVDGGRR
ncbi:hypothetical protein FA95DRAFT_1607857 [Auriscalpium vulgare]|uniref:Uncharacterized protein n=1 Tax=Auriscalpium vulgare TaxID=40419 RepID=A0ACB8RN61_9AGAM|nr:hypothetical protein FA95DRAFT_1607857 [Auriscalpium vulgare]